MTEQRTAPRADLIGRSAELARLAAFLDADSSPVALRLGGEPGIGKTRLWAAALTMARERGFQVLEARAASAEAPLSFAALTDVMSPLVAQIVPRLPAPQRRSLEAAVLLADPPDEMSERTVAVGFASALALAAESARVLVAVDDVQWIDAETRSILEFAIRRADPQRVRFLLTERTQFASSLAAARAGDAIETLALRGVNVAAAHHIVTTETGVPPARRLLQRLYELTRGNPLWLAELAQRVQDPAATDGDLPLPASVEDLLVERVRALSRPARDALAVAALAAGPTTEMLEAALGCDVDEAVMEAVSARMIALDGERVVFTHPLFASAARTTIGPRRRRELHARLAEASRTTEERAWHLAESSPPDEAVAAFVESVADGLLARGARPSAAEMLGQAARLTPEPARDEWARRALRAAEAYSVALDWTHGRELALEVASCVPDGSLRARALACAGRWLPGRNDLIQDALAQPVDDLTRARVCLTAGVNRRQAGEIEDAIDLLQESVECAERVADSETAVEALTMLAICRLWSDETQALVWLERAHAIEARESLPTVEAWLSPGLPYALHHAHQAEDIAAGRDLLARQLGLARDYGDEGSENGILLQLCEVEWRAGDFRRSREYADLALTVGELASDEPGIAQALALRARALVARGALSDAGNDLERASRVLAALGGERLRELVVAATSGFLHAARGDAALATQAFAEAEDGLQMLGVEDPAAPYLWFCADAFEARLAAGDRRGAEDRLRDWERRAQAFARPRALALAAYGRGLLNDDESSYTEALALLEGLAAPWERARVQLAFGTALRRAQRKRAAREQLDGAVTLFAQVGAGLWAERSEKERDRIGGRAAPAGGALSATESEIAALVADGLTNQEVAQALSLSPKTVQWNLSKVYRKLDVRSRTELARRLRS